MTGTRELRYLWKSPSLFDAFEQEIEIMVSGCLELLGLSSDQFTKSDIHFVIYRDPRCCDFLRILPSFEQFNSFQLDKRESTVAIVTARTAGSGDALDTLIRPKSGGTFSDAYVALPVFPQTQIDWSPAPGHALSRLRKLANNTCQRLSAMFRPTGPAPFNLERVPMLKNPALGTPRDTPCQKPGLISNSAPTVLIAAHWLDVGGAENLVIENAKFCKNAGYQVHVLTDTVGPYRLLDKIRDFADKVFLLPNMIEKTVLGNTAHELFKRYEYEVLHIHHCRYIYAVLPSIRLMFPNTRIFDSTHIVEHGNGGFAALAVRYSEYIDAHHVISAQLRTAYTERANVPPRKVHLGYMAACSGSVRATVETGAKYRPQVPRLTPFRKIKLGIPVSVLFVGRMVDQKCPLLFVEFAGRLADQLGSDSVAFTVVGDGPHKDRCMHRTKSLGLSECLEFLPHDVDVARLMAEADFLVSTSNNEGLPLIFFEASENAALCVACDVGSNREIVGERQLLSFNSRTLPHSLAKRVAHLVKSEQKYTFEIEHQMKKHEAILASANTTAVFSRLYHTQRLELRADS